MMNRGTFAILTGLLIPSALLRAQQPKPEDYPQHSMDRPQPALVTPGAKLGDAPSDAIILFDGKNLDAWSTDSGKKAPWLLKDGYMEVAPGTGSIQTRQGFGDCQLHVEWSSPVPATGEGQERGNSGVYLMGQYEVQVLDSYDNKTYPDGQAGALFGQYPPLVNPARKPGEWESYDIIFHAPRFDASGKVTSPARVTVLFNGILVQDDVALTGPTAYQRRPPYVKGADKLPLALQDHEMRVRYRNIWIRNLPAANHP
ncbi:MAG TPA: DUF1080 domain-containing protein [Gemmatimonadales bacterium]|nr:DUF1080 domain-containing protein [Gemmatimonadales bacterium]